MAESEPSDDDYRALVRERDELRLRVAELERRLQSESDYFQEAGNLRYNCVEEDTAMPVHNWSKVDANVFHDFHQAWAMEIRNALNRGLLPPGYSAMVEQRAAGVVPDVIALQRGGRPPTAPAASTLLADPPAMAFVAKTNAAHLARRADRIVIRHRLGRVVCVIEIVSPGNKAGNSAFQSFLTKSVELIESGVNLLILDILPPTRRDPNGIHDAIWNELGGEDFELPRDKPLTLAAYVAGESTDDGETRAYVEPVAVGLTMPDMPAYLDSEHYVPVPLEATYQAAWESCPADARMLVETGKLPSE